MERRRPRTAPARPLVLVVDGHEDTRELYAVALASFGFEIVTVDDGADAFGRAWQTHPDIIVTEVTLPQRDGWGFVEDLKRDPRTRDIPIVLVTGHGELSVRERAAREGCAALLVKPCLPEQLAHALRELLDRKPFSDHASSRRGQTESEPRSSADSRTPGAPDARIADAPLKRTRRSPTFTSTPDTPPPQLLCPTCDRLLVYRQTVISGVKPIERWDYFECQSCGEFVYRDRTRKLRPTA